jgi:pimeloyl-ACP methyl ester carboxylesterase
VTELQSQRFIYHDGLHWSVIVARKLRRPGVGIGAVLALGLAVPGLYLAVPAAASGSGCGGSGKVTAVTGKLADGAAFKIQCPARRWNGTLFLYSHGYVTPGSPNPATDVGDPVTGAWMLGHGFALAGSSYATAGWAIQQALPDQIGTLQRFDSKFGTPTRTIAWGHSLGGIITAGLIQRYPHRFAAALPMCGVLSGGVAVWNTALDAEFAFQRLIDKSIQVVNIKNPINNFGAAEQAVAAAQKTRKGRARIALGASLADTPGWFTPLSKQPGPRDFAAQEANQYQWDSQVDFPFVFALRAELEARAGGNVSWNTGVNYFKELARSADRREVVALYRRAGLSLHHDLARLNNAARVKADKPAVRYLERDITFNGRLPVPVLTLHTTGDGLVVPENERAYRAVVDRAGDGRLLRQIFVHRAGHCAFTPAETITAARVLLRRLATGHWDAAALRSGSLNRRAARLGPAYNIFQAGSKVVATPPAFVRFRPAPFLRPFDQGSPVP